MEQTVKMLFDETISAHIVRLPEIIELSSLMAWGNTLKQVTASTPDGVVLLIDSNIHNFTSIECTQYLRSLLSTDPSVAPKLKRVAFVAPNSYRMPEEVSEREAYFCKYDDAYNWLAMYALMTPR
jgi:hypothetical protein